MGSGFNTLKVKIKSTLEQATKDQSGSKGVSGQRHASAALPPGKAQYP